jgi:hypothetical protein
LKKEVKPFEVQPSFLTSQPQREVPQNTGYKLQVVRRAGTVGVPFSCSFFWESKRRRDT